MIATILSPIIIPIAVKAWFDEKPVLEEINRVLIQ
jgi:hypothetical protein